MRHDDLKKVHEALKIVIEKETDRPINRVCALWAFHGSEMLNLMSDSKDFSPVFGSMTLCVNQTNRHDPSEGWYWGYDTFHPDSRPDEFHGWIVSKKGDLIDFTTCFMRENFEAAKPFMDGPQYTWNRRPLPPFLWRQNFSYSEISANKGIWYVPNPQLTEVVLAGQTNILTMLD